jgi:hypothetical protein
MAYYSLTSYNEDMFLVGILSWWYGAGWAQRISLIKARLNGTIDYFSIGRLSETLFSPYRQISAGAVNGSFGIKLRALSDRTISRFVGFFVRFFVIIIGVTVLALQLILGLVVIAGWIFVPLLPIMGLILYAIGWAPSWL